MAHHRRAVAAAAALNAGIFVAEAIAGYQASSLSLLMDSVHNLSDQLALVALWLAFILSKWPSRTLLRSANIFNSVGLTAVSGLHLQAAVERSESRPGSRYCPRYRGWPPPLQLGCKLASTKIERV